MKYNEFVNERQSFLKIYYDDSNYPYNYTVIKGDELYSVSFRKGKPFLFKYHGKVNKDYNMGNARLIKNPSNILIILSQTKLNSKNIVERKLNMFEEFNESDLSNIELDKISFFNKVKDGAEEFLKDYSKDFKINLVPGKVLTIGTGNPDDLKIIIKSGNDKIHFIAKPTVGPEYEFAYSFDKNGIDGVIGLAKLAFEDEPNQGLAKPISKDKYKADTNEPSVDIREEDVEPLDIPITKKPIRRKRSIDINIIQDVLEDAYILEDIELGNTSVEELIRRMLLETRRRKKTKK